MSLPTTHVLVTGANGGLGLGICTRLIDDFLRNRPQSCSLTLIFTTRSARKGADTRKHLESHLSKNHHVNEHQRIHLRPENVELTNLLSVRALARKLLASSTPTNIPRLDAVIMNAGIGGWSGLNWFLAAGMILYDIVTNTTWPTYKLGIAGLITGPQLPVSSSKKDNTSDSGGAAATAKRVEEPLLGQIFCANVFGHYMLAHWLMPLLSACDERSPGRIIWVSSIEPGTRHYNEDDLMGLRTTTAYESTKRLTDLLALTYDQKAARDAVSTFVGGDGVGQQQEKKKEREVIPSEEEDNFQTPSTSTSTTEKKSQRTQPTMHVAQPGICTTSIVSLHWIMHQFYILGIYLARLAGSPWATMSTYTAALSFTWLTLAPTDEIREEEARFGSDIKGGGKVGRVKWGTAVTRSGEASVKPTEVELWGINGCGRAFANTWWGGRYGRAPGARDAREEDVDEFVAVGARAWREMERLRVEWEERLGGLE